MTSEKDGAAPIDIEAWLNTKASWLRAAAQGLINDRRMPNEAEVDALADHCLRESGKTLASPSALLAPGAIAGTPSRAGLRLERVFDIRGVNALGDQAKLELGGTDLAIVYGPNGSGKSGYARLTKHLCGARLAGPMHGHVFLGAKDTPAASVEVRAIETTGPAAGTSLLTWELATGALPELKAIPVFDTDTSVEFGDSATSATHMPRSMVFMGRLIEISDRVSTNLRRRSDLLLDQLPKMGPELSLSPAAAVLRGLLKPKTQDAAIDAACGVSDEERAERVTLEAALAQANPAELHTKVLQQLELLAKTKQSALDLEGATGSDPAHAIIAARAEAASKRTAASIHATEFFEKVPLNGVGEEIWRQLWAAAEAYSDASAYPDHVHPNVEDGARCVLCQQELGAEGKTRMLGFSEFIQNKLQADAAAAEASFSALVKALLVTPDQQGWATVSQSIGLDPTEGEALRLAVEARTSALKTASDLALVPATDWAAWHAAHANRTGELEKARDKLAGLIDVYGRKANQARLLELQGKEWLAANVEAIKTEAKRLTAVAGLEAAIRSTVTNALTAKNNEIASAELAKGFRDRFNAEVKTLGGESLPVVMNHKAQGKGRFTFCAELRDSKEAVRNRDVLSEGEQRVIALAAFLADATGSNRSLPVVFDDPISSLDQRFEEAVAARIAELAESRQVIVFTHRLSLVTLLQNAHDNRVEKGSKAHCNVIAIGRDGHQAGVPSSVDTFSLKPKPGLGQLINDLGAAKKLEAKFKKLALKDACSTFRILVERTVEIHLCANIVGRFRREIKTMGVLKKLVAIEPNDCTFIDDLMSKYSAFEHSQSDEIPTHLPDADEIIADATSLRSWIDDFEKRAKNAAEGKSAA
ncbi:AAA family ATPase [Luteimonas fraxinea]|uniref:AAA family ATPase n=1 Tax=Luteimonas fraxinea TaxID=2901869 RepID=A0ABS8UAZ1_9GAMM|nr:AAA family ATPase [Luteimonas fraxinea]MCD9096668.1 AAA family ATPase [Luteimonas fraxinea]MCD9126038.1 AAA family ATPase [Luteimonas fraxinea]